MEVSVMLRYDEAVKVWGAGRLSCWSCRDTARIDTSTVTVEFDFDEGYACCGGTDPSCYCSFAEAPRADVLICGSCVCGETARSSIGIDSFDFHGILREIVESGGGTISV
jgi:hypothetical protein